MKRNPFTPEINEVLSPKDFLRRYIDFKLWEKDHPVVRLSSCKENRELEIYGLCCLDHSRLCNENDMLNISGCLSGVFIEPPGFRNFFIASTERIAELESGDDNTGFWTDKVHTEGDSYTEWIWTERNKELSPGFSLCSFRSACRRFKYQPNFSDVARIFYSTEADIQEFWFQE